MSKEHVCHSAKEYARGNVHTNSIEGFWSLVKRAHYGQHHYYTKKYTDLYIGEAVFKYNKRGETSSQIFTSMVRSVLHV